MKKYLTVFLILLQVYVQAGPGDTTVVRTFTFDSIVTRRAVFQFPPKGAARYEKILMYYTLRCDSLTPHDKYPCGEWDYTTYTRVYHKTGRIDSLKLSQPSFSVRGQSPNIFIYSDKPTYSYFESWGQGETETRKQTEGESDQYLQFSGADWLEVPGAAFSGVENEITVAFWLNGDPFRQPLASTVFEGLDAEGKRVINLHVPYDNGVVYWDAGGHGEGLTDNINKPASPKDYKGQWTHWAVTKNSVTGDQKIYLNGELFQAGKDLKRKMDGIASFRIGSNGAGTGKYYCGNMDEFAAWNVELDSAQIRNVFIVGPMKSDDGHLLFRYGFDKAVSGQPVVDDSGNGFDAGTFGNPAVVQFGGMPFPDYKPAPGNVILRDSVRNPLVTIILYGDSLRPDTPTDTLSAWPGWNYYLNSQGIRIDSTLAEDTDTLLRKTRIYYGKPFEVVEQFEIGRFVTPYGKRLDLGPEGFTWVYDVTDYEPVLHGPVDLQAANGQELLDLRFLFIEGIPSRDVISVKNIWSEGSYLYKDLADDAELQTRALRLSPEAGTFMLRARISGHGHYGPGYCCEWIPKKHSWTVNGERSYEWTVWRDCGMNPVHPQGGTWQFDRAGWCPGTFVDTYDYEMTSQVKPGEMVAIDYGIEPYDPDNGEEGGNYEMAMHLFEFTAPNFHTDLELSDILAPSTRHEFRRMNPVSLNPVIRVRNTGADTIRSFSVSYGLKDGKKSNFEWSGKLSFMQNADIILPKPSWKGLADSANPLFVAEIERVNGSGDDRASNNLCESLVGSFVHLPREFILHVKTQGFGRAADNSCKIIDADGKVVYERLVFEDDSIYHDRIKLKPGAYDFTFSDKNEDGMIRHWWLFWEDPDKVGENGELKILDAELNDIMDLGYDWAEKRTLQFFVGEPE
jgi:hypothetical protein